MIILVVRCIARIKISNEGKNHLTTFVLLFLIKKIENEEMIFIK